MADLSQMSDEELKQIAGQRSFNSTLANMSNDQLLQIAGRAGNPDDALPSTMPFGPFDTGIPLPKSLAAFLVGSGRTIDRHVAGVQQPYYAATGQGGKSSALAADQEDKTARYEPLAKARPVSTFLGEVAPTLAAGGPVAMAAMGANEYGTPQERAIRAGFGYVGGKLGQGVARMFGPKSMAPESGRLVDEFFPMPDGNKWGIPLSAGQASQNKMTQIAESVVGNLPFGGTINKARDRTFGEFNRAISHTFGEDASKITPELLGKAKAKAGGTIGELAERNAAHLDPTLARDFARISQRAQSELTDMDAALIAGTGHKPGVLTQILAKIDPETGTISGPIYKAYDSMLGRMAKGAQGNVKDVIGDLRESLRAAMDRSISPADSAAWKKARHDYFNVNQVADATKALLDNISPAQLLQQVNAAQKSSRFGGGNDLAELARWAKQTLPDKIPNSGTAQRLFMQKLLTNPVSGLAGIAGVGAGANQLDVDPRYAAFGLLPLFAGRALAGRPVSDLTRNLLTRAGGSGLLGFSGLATE